MSRFSKIFNPIRVYYAFLRKLPSCKWIDKQIILRQYKISTRRDLDFRNPKTFTEKINCLKLLDRNPAYHKLVDKILVKDWVAKIIGQEYVIPTFGVWKKPEDINFESLPDKFVLKCNHTSGIGIVICRDKSQLDFKKACDELNRGLKNNYYLKFREWPYKGLKRMIFAEELLEDDNSSENVLTDYKFFCFNGQPFMMYVSKDRGAHPTTDFFDMEYNKLPLRMKDPNSEEIPPKPKHFELMKELATKLSKGIPHVRVDFYMVNGKIYFGEMTFFHNAGISLVYPEEWNIKLGQMIDLDLAYNKL